MDIVIEKQIPELRGTGYQLISPKTVQYNCIAWAADDAGAWWWPDSQGICYWPPEVQRSETIEAFIAAFKSLGYEVCQEANLEEGVEKIALYADANHTPTHAARQLMSGKWTSKLGRLQDIQHEIGDVSGRLYGSVAVIMKRAC